MIGKCALCSPHWLGSALWGKSLLFTYSVYIILYFPQQAVPYAQQNWTIYQEEEGFFLFFFFLVSSFLVSTPSLVLDNFSRLQFFFHLCSENK